MGLELTPAETSDAVVVEFDPYTPVTVTWPAYHGVSMTPLYVRCAEEHRLLELKFHPGSADLVELVLVNAPGLQRQESAFPEQISDGDAGLRLTDLNALADVPRLRVTAFEDCLLMRFAEGDFASWEGNAALFYGVSTSGEVGAIGVRWSEDERLLVLE